MKILITSPTYPPCNSGLGNAVATQASFLLNVSQDLVVATGGLYRHSYCVAGINVEAFPVSESRLFTQWFKGDISGYVSFLSSRDWDLVLLNAWQNWATDLVLNNINLISGHKVLYSHCISTNVLLATRPLKSFLRYLLWRAYWRNLPSHLANLDGLIFLAPGSSDSRFDDYKLASSMRLPIRVVPNALSPSATSLVHANDTSQQIRDRIISVGSYTWQKGFDFVIRAYAASRARQFYPLHLYGQEFSKYTSYLKSLCARIGIHKGEVIFHEGISGDRLLACYSKAYLFLHGSHTECQPLVLLDAMATGTPFISRGTGCIPDLKGGKTVSTANEMTIVIDSLFANSVLWKELSVSGMTSALHEFHPNVVSNQFLDALHDFGAF